MPLPEAVVYLERFRERLDRALILPAIEPDEPDVVENGAGLRFPADLPILGEVAVPNDLAGVVIVDYDESREDPIAATGAACTQMARVIKPLVFVPIAEHVFVALIS